MKKQNTQITLDTDVYLEIKRKKIILSPVINSFMKKYLEMRDSPIEELESKKNQLEEQIDALKNELSAINIRITNTHEEQEKEELEKAIAQRKEAESLNKSLRASGHLRRLDDD